MVASNPACFNSHKYLDSSVFFAIPLKSEGFDMVIIPVLERSVSSSAINLGGFDGVED